MRIRTNIYSLIMNEQTTSRIALYSETFIEIPIKLTITRNYLA